MGINYFKITEPASNIRMKFGNISGHPEWVLINLEGYLDNQNTPAFLKTVKAAITPSVRVLGFDLAELSYISSTGVGAFSALTLDCRQAGRFFFLSSVPERIDKVLKLLGFGSLFPQISDPASHDFSKYSI